ncbi:MAG: FecR domain-containing protein [Deltaproteobacteria bacterium]|nr:FecR domain-containing protein [Deltaproteobacteria bacterium]
MKQAYMIFSVFSIIVVLALVFVPPANAQEKVVGSVVAVRGDVTAVDAGGISRRLSIKSAICLADTIKTGKRGRVQVMFDDNTLISLGQNSEMKIAEYEWNPEQKTGAMETRIKEGAFRVMGGTITQVAPKNFKTKTPAATIGIRGSMYAGKVAGGSLSVLLLGGKGIYVTNAAGTVTITKGGYGTFVKGPDVLPALPTRYTDEDLMDLDKGFSGEEDVSKDDAGSEDESGQDSTAGTGDDFATLSPENTFESPADTVSEIVNDVFVASSQDILSTGVLEPEQSILNLLYELGFSGGHSSSVPDNGIEKYYGVVRGSSAGSLDIFNAEQKVRVNWYNKKFFSVVVNDLPEHKLPVFTFGDVSGTGLANIKVVGSDLDVNWVSAINGFGTFGQFYGSNTDAVGVAIQGLNVNVENQSDVENWTAIGAAVSQGIPASYTVAPTGTKDWYGFVVGVSEDMAAVDLNRRVFMNSQSTDFKVTINKDLGTLSGNMSATDFEGSSSTINNLQIGGSLGSAYVFDDTLVAVLGGGNSITTNAISGGLKAYGNYMATADSASQFAEYATWGYWEIAYNDPYSGKDYHVHIPGAMWIAGEQTPSTAVDNLISTSFVGTYLGGAEGIKFNSSGMISDLTGGSTNLTLDFNPSASTPVTGTISFDQVNLNVTSTTGAITNSGFSAEISGTISSDVNGTYYGPNAEAIGGNFGAKMNSGESYNGIFAGSR